MSNGPRAHISQFPPEAFAADDLASVAGRHHRLEPVARLYCYRTERHRRLLSLRNMLLHHATGHASSTVVLALIVTATSMRIGWRDAKISARLMLWIEAVLVTLIMTVIALVLLRHGLHLDGTPLRLRGMTGRGLSPGLVLALFSSAGFENATALGSEARKPLKTIPRAAKA